MKPEAKNTTKNATNRILVLMSDCPARGAISAPLQAAGYELFFCSSTQEAFLLIPKVRPQVLLHDWGSIEETQAIAFHQRLMRIDEYESLCRVLVVKEVLPNLVALSIDCGIRRLLTQAAAKINIVEEIRMAVAAEGNLSSLQRRVREMKLAPQNYNQSEIDLSVEEAYHQFSHDPAVKLEFGNLCARREQLPQAETIANSLLAAEPSNVRAMNLLSRVYMKTGRFEEGIQVLENANVLSPKNPERLASLGNAFLKKGDKASAKKYLVESLEVDPQNKEAAAGLGEICLSEGDALSVIDMFQNSLSEEEIVSFFNNAAVQSVRAGKVGDALRLYDMALDATMTSRLKCAVQFNIGLAYRRMGELDEARRAFKKCLRLDSNFAKARKQLDEVEAELGNAPQRSSQGE